jgi:hypothetical protein
VPFKQSVNMVVGQFETVYDTRSLASEFRYRVSHGAARVTSGCAIPDCARRSA